MKELIGRTIRGIAIKPGEGILAFGTDEGTLGYQAEGDCCSETWFAEILGVDALLDAKVSAVEELELPTVLDGKSRQSEDLFYGIKLDTDKGTVKIVYRNSSNGYYGGSLSFVAKVNPEGWTAITKDWEASSDGG